jgi:hypothetical protein
MDDDDRKETNKFVKECLPNGYRKYSPSTSILLFMMEFLPPPGIALSVLNILCFRILPARKAIQLNREVMKIGITENVNTNLIIILSWMFVVVI